MGDVVDLTGGEAVQKMKDLADGAIGMMCTFPGDHPLDARPMATQRIDDDGSVWFITRIDSPKIEHLRKDPTMVLIYAATPRSEFLDLQGRATVTQDKAKIDELWSPMAGAWFPDGKDDPAVALIRFVAERGHYWDAKTNRAVQLAKIAVGAVLGKPFDDGLEGELKP